MIEWTDGRKEGRQPAIPFKLLSPQSFNFSWESYTSPYYLLKSQVRDQSEISRRGTYLPKVPTKSRTLEAIAAARLEVSEEEEKKEKKKRIAKDLENKMNPYNYDLNNLKIAAGGMLPAEHLLILSANGADTKDIVNSDTNAFKTRTELAYKVGNVIFVVIIANIVNIDVVTIIVFSIITAVITTSTI